jgi:hypothetical protein
MPPRRLRQGLAAAVLAGLGPHRQAGQLPLHRLHLRERGVEAGRPPLRRRCDIRLLIWSAGTPSAHEQAACVCVWGRGGRHRRCLRRLQQIRCSVAAGGLRNAKPARRPCLPFWAPRPSAPGPQLAPPPFTHRRLPPAPPASSPHWPGGPGPPPSPPPHGAGRPGGEMGGGGGRQKAVYGRFAQALQRVRAQNQEPLRRRSQPGPRRKQTRSPSG